MRHISSLLAFVSAVSCALLGVDYGQQFSKAMVVSPQAPLELVLTPDSKRKDISGLAIKISNDDIERVYGSGVEPVQVKYPQNAFLHMKPLLGKSLDEDLNMYHKQHPGVLMESTERGTISFHTSGYDYPVEELVAMNLEQVIGRAELLLQENGGHDAVDALAITVPEYFTQEERLALLDASRLLKGVKTYLVNDGLTIAINFALNHRDFPAGEAQHYIVYDMGSGATRASLISVKQPLNESEPLEIEFGGYGYDKSLSGSQLTLSVANLLQNKFLERHSSIRTDSFEASAKSLVKLIQAAEKAKLILSANTEASVTIESLYDDLDFKATITRQEFEDYNQDLANDVLAPIAEALKNQYLDVEVDRNDIKSIILTGGSTRVPFVQKQLANFVGEEKVAKNVNADESSVNGVTIRGVQLFKSFKVKSLNVIDKSIFDYSVQINESGIPMTIFEQGSTYPNSTSLILPLSNQTTDFTIDLYENDRLFKTLDVATDAIKDRFTKKKCPYGIAYNATLSLSQNRIFNLDSIDAVCLQKSEESSGIFGKLFGGVKNTEYDQVDLDGNDAEAPTNELKDSLTRPKRLSITGKYVHVKPMNAMDRLQVQQHMSLLKDKDGLRLKLQEQRNTLETVLYDARNYLEEIDAASRGPRPDVEKLSVLVSEYLEWLDYDSDSASMQDLVDKILEISHLRDKIDLFIKSADDPLDQAQFQALCDKGTSILEQIENHYTVENTTLESLNEEFAELGLDVKKEYHKLKAPRYLPKSTQKLTNNLEVMHNLLDDIHEIIESKQLTSKTREDLFEIKLHFDTLLQELEQSLDVLEATKKYRLSELAALYNRRLRVLKRKEDRKKAQESSTVLNSFNSTTAENESSSTSSLKSSSSASEIVHDEL